MDPEWQTHLQGFCDAMADMSLTRGSTFQQYEQLKNHYHTCQIWCTNEEDKIRWTVRFTHEKSKSRVQIRFSIEDNTSLHIHLDDFYFIAKRDKKYQQQYMSISDVLANSFGLGLLLTRRFLLSVITFSVIDSSYVMLPDLDIKLPWLAVLHVLRVRNATKFKRSMYEFDFDLPGWRNNGTTIEAGTVGDVLPELRSVDDDIYACALRIWISRLTHNIDKNDVIRFSQWWTTVPNAPSFDFFDLNVTTTFTKKTFQFPTLRNPPAYPTAWLRLRF